MVTPIDRISTTSFDIYPLGYYAAADHHTQPFKLDHSTRTLAEKFPKVPPWRFIHPALRTQEGRRFLFTSELVPFMDEYWDHFRSIAVERELTFRIAKRDEFDRALERNYERQIDYLKDYVVSLLFERVFFNVLARRRFFLNLTKHKISDQKKWVSWYVEQRINDTKYWPLLLRAYHFSPSQFNICVPNHLNDWQSKQAITLQSPRVINDYIQLTRVQQASLSFFLGQDFESHIQEIAKALKDRNTKQIEHSLLLVDRLFKRAWQTYWPQHNTFRNIVQQQMTLRLSFIPELWQNDFSHFPQYITNEMKSPSALDHRTIMNEAILRQRYMGEPKIISSVSVHHGAFEVSVFDSSQVKSQRSLDNESLIEAKMQFQKTGINNQESQFHEDANNKNRLQQINYDLNRKLAAIDYTNHQLLNQRFPVTNDNTSQEPENSIKPLTRSRKAS